MPDPGGPVMIRLWPPAAATSSARLACSCPRMWRRSAGCSTSSSGPSPSRCGSGDGRVQVVYATPGTQLQKEHVQAEHQGEQLVLHDKHPIALQAYRRQYSEAVVKPKPVKTKVAATAITKRPAPVPEV